MKDIIKMADERGEFVYLEDGFLYYAPEATGGCIAAHELRALADELDRRNKTWEDQVNEYFRNQQRSEASGGMDGGSTCGEDDFGNSPATINRASDS